MSEAAISTRRIEILTDHPVALDSPDHLHPWGTAHDNYRCGAFNEKLFRLIPGKLSVLDLGCSGGGFVKDMIDNGHFAVGIEGSDFSKKHGRAEWREIPDNLFTADITQHFMLVSGEPIDDRRIRDLERCMFRVITAWDVIEHIKRSDIPSVMGNIGRHLLPSGMVIMSISPNEEAPEGVPLHQTVEGRNWWLGTFWDLGWQNHPEIVEYFGEDMVRGGSNAPNSFHVVLTRTGERPILAVPLL